MRHPLVQQAETKLETAVPDWFGLLRTGPGDLDITVSALNVDRALRVADLLVQKLEAAGMEVSNEEQERKTTVRSNEEVVRIRLMEPTRRLQHTPTPKERRLMAEQKIGHNVPEWDYVPSRRLAIVAIDEENVTAPNEWADTDEHRLEGRIDEVVSALREATHVKSTLRHQGRERKEAWSDSEKKHKVSLEKRRHDRKESARLRDLARQLQDAQAIRELVAIAREKLMGWDEKEEIEAWCKWAESEADALDPSRRLGKIILSDKT